MRPTLIVKLEVAAERSARLADAVVGVQIDLLVFDATPEPLDEHVVAPGAFAVHADRNAVVGEHAGEGRTGELDISPLEMPLGTIYAVFFLGGNRPVSRKARINRERATCDLELNSSLAILSSSSASLLGTRIVKLASCATVQSPM